MAFHYHFQHLCQDESYCGFYSYFLPCPTYVIYFPLNIQVKYKADLKKLHKPVTDMKESLIMNHVLNTSQLASSVSSFTPETASFTRLHQIPS